MKIRSTQWLATIFGTIMLVRIVGFFLSPLLLVQAPIVLILMSPIVPHLSLVANFVPAYQYYPVAVFVAMIHSLFGYLLGQRLGEAALTWCFEHHPSQKRKVMMLSRWMERSSFIAILLFPGPLLSLLVGSVRMRWEKFLILTFMAQVLWTILCRFLGTSLYDIITKML